MQNKFGMDKLQESHKLVDKLQESHKLVDKLQESHKLEWLYELFPVRIYFTSSKKVTDYL